jgi:hypothetical protein
MNDGKRSEGNQSRLILKNFPAFIYRDWGKPRKPRSGTPPYGPNIELGTSPMRSRSAESLRRDIGLKCTCLVGSK